MSHRLRFQVLVLPNISWERQLRRAHLIEELGFDVLATGDHLVDWTGPEKPFFESMTGLAAFAAETSSIRLTSAVAQIGLRHPALFAHMVVGIDHISGGRFEPGIGTGLRMDPGTEMAGLENWSNAERVARLAEYAEVLHLLLTQPVSSYEGEYYRIDGMVTNPLPVQQPRPPITIAALGPRMVRLAARHADIWNSLSFKSSWEEQLEETRRRIEQLQVACTAVGRDPSDLRWSFTLFEPDSRHHGGALSYYTSPETFAAKTRQLQAMGFSEISVYYPMDDSQLPAFEEIAREVLPELRK